MNNEQISRYLQQLTADSGNEENSGSEIEDAVYEEDLQLTDSDSDVDLEEIANSTESPSTLTNITYVQESTQSAKSEVNTSIISFATPGLRGKNKHKWSTLRAKPAKLPGRNIIHVKPGPSRNCRKLLDPLTCFELFITRDIIGKIVTYTNAEIEVQSQKYEQIRSTQSPIDGTELKALLGILVLTAALKDNHLTSRELFDSTYCGNRYRACMSAERFDFLINCLRFDDKTTRLERRAQDSFAPIREIWSLFIDKCEGNYKPSSYVTIDEQLLAFRGRCGFRMYIPNKPAKYGIKLVMMCDNSTKYMINAMPYLGSGTNSSGLPLGEFYVKELTKSIHGTNRNVTTDNWFTSVPLAKALLKEPYKLTQIGTIRSNKREIPPEFQNSRSRLIGTSMFCFDGPLTLLSYKPKANKVVFLLSTSEEEVNINPVTKKPNMVEFYNRTKGGVDTLDQMCSVMTCSRKTRRWPQCIFYGILNIAFVNSYVIYCANMFSENKEPLSRRKFMKELHNSLTKEWMEKRLQKKSIPTSLREVITNILEPNAANQPETSSGQPANKKRKICAFCPSSKRRMSKTQCAKCGKTICGEHKVEACHSCTKNKL